MWYRINWHAATKRVVVESGNSAYPAAISGGGYTSIGTFRHNDASEALPGMQKHSENHVLYHHVQEALYKIGVQDMQSVAIFNDQPRSIALPGGTLSLAVNASSAPLAVTSVPENVPKDVIFTTSDATKATVSSKGVVKGIAAGSATITAKLRANETITATRAVTVNA